MKKKVSLFLTALCCTVGAYSASETDSVQVTGACGSTAVHRQRTDNDGYTRFRVGGYGEAVASFKDYGINRYYTVIPMETPVTIGTRFLFRALCWQWIISLLRNGF